MPQTGVVKKKTLEQNNSSKVFVWQNFVCCNSGRHVKIKQRPLRGRESDGVKETDYIEMKQQIRETNLCIKCSNKTKTSKI